MNYKILCSDLDGTLLSSKNDVSDFTVNEINRIKDRIKIILVSARMPKSMTYLQKRMGIEENPIVCYNGALVLEANKVIHSTTISISKTKELHALCKAADIKLGLYQNDDWCVAETSERVEKEIFNTKARPTFEPTSTTLERWEAHANGPHKIMLMGSKQAMDEITPVLQARFSDEMNGYRSNDTLIEIAPKTVSKLQAIRSLLQPGESLEDVIAFGDNFNDVEMLEKVGCGVAVYNAREAAKKAANHLTLSNTEHGVAQFIQDHL
ncbi:Cof-type HAD-IIB family hydrolase [Flagellimonas myxillae]|uniref:Cof-type HAD-IIB family hydrolase n=1 Tax=Flagellimonas myxillae TaxID=2942214 RepID=UPI00201EB9AC|nr:Cof-type HAD-IIB family hydrolase [Muricauda myxillae]MCL6267952.1 Cof-type HAD-IIB family hydrolase [Muricauda myxillae]